MAKHSPTVCLVSADPRRVSIAGAGPTGSLLALGLAQLGFQVILQDPLRVEDLMARSRAYALTHSSRRLLNELGLWDALGSDLIPFRSLDLQDRELKARVVFTPDDLAGGNRLVPAIGWILDHRPLMELLLDRLASHPSVQLQLGAAPAPHTPQGRFDLAIACDGPASPHRGFWKLPFWSWTYQQGCLTFKVRLRNPQAQTAYELFRCEGPFAVLPLGQNAFQIVWSAPLECCRERAALSPDQLLKELFGVLPEGLELEAFLDQPRAFPLQLSLAPRLARGGLLLVGESGHRCHPVGGQGLNVCWRDVAELLRLLKHPASSRLSGSAIGRRYARSRLPDLILVGLATDLLVRLFSNRNPLLLLLRRMGLSSMGRFGVLRQLSLAAMTDGPLAWRR